MITKRERSLRAGELDILLDPLVEHGLDGRIRHFGRVSPPGGLARGAAVDLEKVPAVGVEAEAHGATVAFDVGVSRAELDVGGGGLVALQPVLRRGVAEVEDNGREAGDGVVAVGDAVLLAGLGGDKLGKVAVADAGRAEGVDVDRVARLAEVGGGDGGGGSAEGVPGHDDLVLGVGGPSSFTPAKTADDTSSQDAKKPVWSLQPAVTLQEVWVVMKLCRRRRV